MVLNHFNFRTLTIYVHHKYVYVFQIIKKKNYYYKYFSESKIKYLFQGQIWYSNKTMGALKQIPNIFSKIISNMSITITIPIWDKAQRHITGGALYWCLCLAVPAPQSMVPAPQSIHLTLCPVIYTGL